MKKAIFLLGFALFLAESTAQPWVVVGTEWSFWRHQFGPTPPPDPIWKCTDTATVSGRLCSKLVGDPACAAVQNTELYFYEEAEKVFFWAGGQFHLLYDFGAAVGAAWPISAFNGIASTVTVTGDTTLHIFGKTRRGLFLKNSESEEILGNLIVEGIGSLQFLLPQIPFCDPVVGGLICFHDPQIVGQPTCIVRADEPKRPFFMLAPNPTDGQIRLGGDFSGLKKAEIIATDGRDFGFFDISETGEINLARLPNGIFWLRFLDEKSGRVWSGKVVKTATGF